MPNLSEMHERSIAALFALGLLALPGAAPAANSEVNATLNNKWSPATQKVAKGSKVTFSNPTQQPHDFKPYKGPWPKKKAVWLYEGESVSYKLAEKGKYLFRCFLHSEMDAGECTGMCGSVTTK